LQKIPFKEAAMARLVSAEQARAGHRRRARRVAGREIRLDRTQVDDLLVQTEDPDADVRNEAVRALCPCHVQANVDRVWDRLVAMVADSDSRVRGSVVHALCDGSPRERELQVVEALEQMYNDPDPKLRRHVRHVLASYRRRGKINIL
jgi:HEAT repeat protein